MSVGSGKYRLDQRLGGGGMAEVFLGSTVGAEGFSRKIAIKRVLPGYSENEAFARMFVEEARISSQLVHPNIVSVLDFDRDPENRLFLVMELVEGKDLDALVGSGLLPFAVVVFVVAEVLRGLGYAHDLPVGNEARGVVHRDISPHNVLLSWAGAVKVSDFGIAKARAASEATASVFIKGKPAYMSPEQANGQPLDGRSDLFAVGIMLWEMLVGRRLFTGEDTRSTLAAVLFGQIPRPRSLRGEIPKDIERVTMKLLERDLPARYATAEDALHELLDCVDSPKAGREALTAILAERFPLEAPVRQSLLRARSAGNASLPPTIVATRPQPAAALSLGAMMNAPTGTIDDQARPGRSRLAKLLLVAIVTIGSAIGAFAIVSALRHSKSDEPERVAEADPGSGRGSGPTSGSGPGSGPPGSGSAMAPPDATNAQVPLDASGLDALNAATPPDAKKDAPRVQVAEKKYGKLFVTSEPYQVTIYIDGRPFKDSPRTIDKVLVGKRKLHLVNTDAGIDHYATVTIKENQTEPFHYVHKK